MRPLRIFISFILVGIFAIFIAGSDWIAWDNSKPGTAPSVTVLASDGTHVRVRIELHGFWMKTLEGGGLTFQQPVLPGEEFLRQTGKPQVPSIGRLFAVPEGKKTAWRILDAQSISMSGCGIHPTQPKPNRCEDLVFPFTLDESVYSADTYFPGELAAVGEPGVFRDYRVVRLAVYPLQFNPARENLEIYTSLDLELQFEEGDTRAPVLFPSNAVSASFDNLYRATIANYDWVKGRKEISRSTPENMLIFVADALESSIADFVQWKKQCGLNVTVRKMSEVGNTVVQIKAAIQSAYDNVATRPDYVVFVGDENTVVPDHRSTSNGNAASDYPYTLLSGEANDVDPDVLLGRLVGATSGQILIQTDKIIYYEKQPDAGGAWYKKCAGIASNEGSGPSDEEYITSITDTLMAHTYTYRDLWFQRLGNATAANINAGLTEGRTWLTYIGHGSGTSWGSTNGTYNNSSVDGMNNGYKMPILVDVACENGSFDDSTECFGEKWMRAGSVGSPRGAVGYYGGSVSISWDPPAIMAQGIAIHHYSDPVYTWGGSCLAGQMYLKAQNGGGSDTIDNFEWFILFGDPSLMIRTDTPRALQVTHDENMVFGQDVFDVTVLTGSSVPVAGARVYAYSSAEPAVAAYALTDSAGNAHLEFATPPSLDGTLHVTVTGYNLQTYLGTAVIVPGQPCDAPGNFAAANAGDNHILLTWDASPHADGGYLVYRSAGGCTGAFVCIGNVNSGTSYDDYTVSGGLTYSYKVKSVCGGYGGVTYTACQEVQAVGDCFLMPVFAGIQSIEVPLSEQCELILHWNPGQSSCPEYPGITYSIYRAMTSGGPYSTLAANLTGTSYMDTGVESGQNYYYRVRAVDEGGNEDDNATELGATPLGPIQVVFADDIEGTEPNGWTHNAASGTDDWHYVTDQSHSSSHAWFASDPSTVKDDRLMTPPIPLSQAAELSFWHRYNLENTYDGGVLEISTDGGVTFSDLGAHITLNGYNGTISTGYQNPVGGRPAWTGSMTTWKEVTVDLSAYGGQTAVIRFRLGSDTMVAGTGWWVDDVVISQATECQSSPVVMGDLNQDLVCDATDAVILAMFLAGSIQQGEAGFTAPLDRADMDQSSGVDSTDLTQMLQAF